MDTNTIVDHERSAIYTKLWYLAQKNEYDRFTYFVGLTDAERQDLTDIFTDLLDIERRQILGPAFPKVVSTEEKTKPVEDVPPHTSLDIHDPAHYSFGGKGKWVPYAQDLPSGAKRGKYTKNYPLGAVVHWTAGHRSSLGVANGIMRDTGMLYLLIDAAGALGQSDALTDHGYHSGASSHPKLSGYVSDDLVGIEVMAAGNLTQQGEHYYPWWDRKNGSGPHQFHPSNRIPASEVVHSGKRSNIAPGYYHKYTEAQTTALRKTICWLYLNDPETFSIDLVLGHDEVSPTRKTDPGAALIIDGRIYTMPEFRDVLRADVTEILRRKSAA